MVLLLPIESTGARIVTESTGAEAPPLKDEDLRCVRCEYNLTGLTSSVCPECGSAWKLEGSLNAGGVGNG